MLKFARGVFLDLKWGRLMHWLDNTGHDDSYGPKQSMKLYEDQDGLAVKAGRDIEEGELLWKVPLQAMLNTYGVRTAPGKLYESVFADEDADKYISNMELLATRLMYEKYVRGEASMFDAYITMLPNTTNHLIEWSEEELNQVRGSVLYWRAHQSQARAVKSFEIFQRTSWPEVFPKDSQPTMEMWKWSLGIVYTRSFPLTTSMETGEEAERALVPGVDMHRMGEHPFVVTRQHPELDDDGNTVRVPHEVQVVYLHPNPIEVLFRATADLKKGSPLESPTMYQCPFDMLENVGVLPESIATSEEICIVMPLGLGQNDPLFEEKKTILLEETPLNFAEEYALFRESVDPSLVAFARLAMADEETIAEMRELQAFRAGERKRMAAENPEEYAGLDEMTDYDLFYDVLATMAPVTLQNEVEAMAFIVALLEEHLNSFEDEELGITRARDDAMTAEDIAKLSIRERSALRLRKAEREVADANVMNFSKHLQLLMEHPEYAKNPGDQAPPSFDDGESEWEDVGDVHDDRDEL